MNDFSPLQLLTRTELDKFRNLQCVHFILENPSCLIPSHSTLSSLSCHAHTRGLVESGSAGFSRCARGVGLLLAAEDFRPPRGLDLGLLGRLLGRLLGWKRLGVLDGLGCPLAVVDIEGLLKATGRATTPRAVERARLRALVLAPRLERFDVLLGPAEPAVYR